MERKTIAELILEENVRKATEEVKKAILRDKRDASSESINKATRELSKAIIRSRC